MVNSDREVDIGLVAPIVEQVVPGSDGVGLHVRRRDAGGTGLPVLAVHGLSSNARLWDAVGERLARLGHPVAAVDQRGHGRSERNGGGWDFATLAADLVAVIDSLGWRDERRPLVAGQSWGGNVAIELAVRHPDAVRALALIDGGTIELADRFADWPTARAALAPPDFQGIAATTIETGLRDRHPDWPESGIEATMANFEILPDGTVRPWLRLDDHMAILSELWAHRPSTRYPQVAVPVLLVPAIDPSSPGARFMTVKRNEVVGAEHLLPRSATRWMTGDHDLHAQHPEAVADLLHDAADLTIFEQ
jgi:pimeloyl-ACP methyl ester carboxylesterase